jgi:hypothetical protein
MFTSGEPFSLPQLPPQAGAISLREFEDGLRLALISLPIGGHK